MMPETWGSILTRTARGISVSTLLVLLAAGSAGADTIFLHTGASDPTTEGWTQSLSGSATVGPVTDGGVNAWNVTDPAGVNGGGYFAVPNSTQITAGSTQGWVLRADLRVVTATATNPPLDTAVHEDIMFTYRDGTTSWDVRFGQQADGDPVVYLILAGADHSTWPSYALEGAGSTYHLYELRYDPVAQNADLFVDGVERISNYVGASLAQTQVFWGAGSSADSGQANYQLVEFEVVPEPGTVTLMGSGIATLGVWLARWRRRPRS